MYSWQSIIDSTLIIPYHISTKFVENFFHLNHYYLNHTDIWFLWYRYCITPTSNDILTQSYQHALCLNRSFLSHLLLLQMKTSYQPTHTHTQTKDMNMTSNNINKEACVRQIIIIKMLYICENDMQSKVSANFLVIWCRVHMQGKKNENKHISEHKKHFNSIHEFWVLIKEKEIYTHNKHWIVHCSSSSKTYLWLVACLSSSSHAKEDDVDTRTTFIPL